MLSILRWIEGNPIPMVRHHHEVMDGSGYPDGLKKDDIPVGARVLGLFNYLDNLIFPRSSETAMSIEDALVEIIGKAGQQFDQDLIQNFIGFVESNSGKSLDYLKKKQTSIIRPLFAEILGSALTATCGSKITRHTV